MNQDNRLQYLTTILAYTLPVLQFLYALLNSTQREIFLFSKYFVVVSVIAAIICYILILMLKTNPYIQYTPFQSNRKDKYREWEQRTNRYVFLYNKKDVDEYLKNHIEPKRPFVLNQDNITPRVLLPLLSANFLLFLILGLVSAGFRGGHPTLTATFTVIQATSYLMIIGVAVLSFSLFYYRSKNQHNFTANEATTYDKALKLARANNTFAELQSTSLIAQKVLRSDPLNNLNVFVIQVGVKYFIFATNLEITKAILVIPCNTIEEAMPAYESLGN
jgi:hypothetical protein